MKWPSLDRWIRSSVTLALLAGTAAAFAPYYLASRQMQRFCDGLNRGATAQQIAALAQPLGYELGAADGSRAVLADPLAYGRRQCELHFGPAGLVSSRYSTGD